MPQSLFFSGGLFFFVTDAGISWTGRAHATMVQAFDFWARADLNVLPCEQYFAKWAQKPTYLWEALGTPAPTELRAPRLAKYWYLF